MASAIRSKLSARTAKAALFIVQAEDEIVNPWSELRHEQVRKSVGEQLLNHPNMNATGRPPPKLCDVSRWHASAPDPVGGATQGRSRRNR